MQTNRLLNLATAYVLLFGLLVFSLSCKKDDELNPVPVEKVPKIQKVAYTDKDFYEFSYTNEGKLQTFMSQWVYMEGGSLQTRKVVTEYSYNSAGLLELANTQGLQTKYFYNGTTLSRTEEYDHQNRLIITKHYTFNSLNKLKEVHDVITDPTENNKITAEFKKTFVYDSMGNLVLLTDLTKQENGKYEIRRTTQYDGFDTKKYLPLEFYPYLPGVQLFVNNPLKETAKSKDGTLVKPIETYTYEYNTKDYPVKKSITYTGGSQPGSATITYTYMPE
jgi:hypothetical protein